jgi:hypothetical protein
MDSLKPDISCKQKALMSKMEEYDILVKQRAELQKVIDEEKGKK